MKLYKFPCVTIVAFLCTQSFNLRGDKPSQPHEIEYPPAPLHSVTAPFRKPVPQPRLLAQARAAQPAPAAAPKPAVSISSPLTPDDPTDPYVTAQATVLNHDPNQIYTFVRDQIHFEAYPGSLRGARGTLWAMAGNTLDKASLLVALLEASGFTARYEHTTLNSTSTGRQALVNLNRSMFPPATVLLGCIPTSAQLDDPGTNGYATGWTNDYYWVEYGPGNVDLDPNIPGGQPGQTVQAPDSSFDTVSQSLQQQVTVSMIAETYSQANGLFGFGPQQNTVLSQTFYTWQLVGNILSAGNIVQSTVTGSFDLSGTTFTYTPYLLIGSEAADVTQDAMVTGTSYQEFFTNFPLSSILLTGLFVQVQANNAFQQQPQTYTHTMLDRIGPAVRQGNSSARITLPDTLAPAVTNFDIATVNILPTRVNVSAAFQAQKARINTAYQNYESIKTAYQALPTNGTPLTAAQQVVAQQAANLSKYLLITENELITLAYDGAADQLAGQLDSGYDVRIYPSAPRITIANSSTDAAGDALFSFDVLKNDMFVINGLTQNTMTSYYEEVARGIFESNMEASIVTQATGLTNVTDISGVMGALGDPSNLLFLAPGNFNAPPDTNQLESTSLSADAQTLILNAVNAGDVVITPNQMVTVNGVQTVAWWETDQFGHTVSHFPNGDHGAFQDAVEYDTAEIYSGAYNGFVAKLIGYVEGTGLTGYAFAAATLDAVVQNAPFTATLKTTKNILKGLGTDNPQANFYATLVGYLNKFLDIGLHGSVAAGFSEGPSLIGDFFDGLSEGIEDMVKLLETYVGEDPEVFTFLGSPLGPPLPGVTPGASPGVTVAISTDQTFTMPYNGNELPVYDVTVTNTGPATDTFSFQAADNSRNYQLGIASPGPNLNPLLTLQPGQTGEMNLCALPNGTPAVGGTGGFEVTATGSNSGATGSASTNYTVPPLPILSLTADPQVLTVSPGGTVAAVITLGSLGNAGPGSVALTATPQTGISVSGLSSPVTVPLNGVITQALTFTAAANVTVNSTYTIQFSAAFSSPSGGPQSVPFVLPITVQALGTCTANAALTAQQTAGVATLSTTFTALDFDMNAAAQAPTSAALISRIGGDLVVLENALSTVTFLQGFVPALAAAGSAVASANSTTLLAALNGLDNAICPIQTAMSEASSYNVQISLAPNSLVTGPNLPATFQVAIYNPQSTMKVYNLTVTGVPSGVTAQFNQPSVTVTPNEATVNSNPVTLTLTPGASFTTPFTFTVVATPAGAPEFAISAPGSLLARPQAVSIDQVTMTPAYGPPGTQFVITARVFAEVNQSVSPVSLVAQPYNSSGAATANFYTSSSFTLTPATTLQMIAIGTIDSTNFADGPYTVSVTALGLGNATFAGSTAAGSFLVGAPLSATLTANANSTPPATVPSGSSSVQVALNITRDTSAQNPISTLVGTVQLQGISRSMALYQNGQQQLAYACSDSYVNIVDVTNPAHLTLLGTFANSLLTTENGNPVAGYQVVACNVYNSDLVLSYSRYDGNTTTQPIPTHFAVFSLSNPLSPTQVGSVVDVQRPDSLGLYVAGSTALMYQSTTFYDPVDQVLYQETGDVWTGDLTNVPTTGAINYLNDVYSCGGTNASGNCNNTTTIAVGAVSGGVCNVTPTPVPNDPYRGGPYRIGPGTAVNSTTTYFASTSASGGNVENPGCPTITGQLLVVDTSSPASPAIVASIGDPAMAFMTGVAVQGNLAIAVGDSLGIFTSTSGYVGTLVISAFDISNPRSPQLTSSITTQLADSPGSFVVPLGNNTFAVGNTSLNGNGILVLVDASNPSALRYIPYNAVLVANPTVAQNGYFFALSATPAATQNALSAFQLSEVTGPQITLSLELPNSGNAVVDAASFSLAPSTVTTGATYNTYVWNQPAPNTITFNVKVGGVNPGDVTTVVTGGQMAYTLPTIGPGTFALPAVTVLCQQIVTISPTANSISSGGQTATYMVTVNNPTGTSQTFVPSTIGIPPTWSVQAPASVTVAAGSNQTFNVTMTPPLYATPEAIFNFFVVLSTSGGITASVGASLSVSSLPSTGPSNNVSASYTGFTAGLSPGAITIGQGGAAMFQVSVTNTGSSAARFSLQTANPYAGWSLNFNPSSGVTILPGLSNTVTVTGQISIPAGTTAGSYPVTIQVENGSETQSLSLTVNVVSAGVTASISPGSGAPATSFSLRLNNVGSVADTYNLTVQGALIGSASIPNTSGPIQPSQSVQVPITLAPINFVTPGNYTLQIEAVSQANSSVVAYASATIQVPGAQSVTAAINPSPASVATTPGAVTLLLQVTNTGNVPDSYTAAITNISNNVTANINGAQSIPAFPIPPLSTAQVPLNAALNTGKSGSLTVTITSASNSSETAQASVTIGQGSICDVNQDGTTNVIDVQIMAGESLGTDAPMNDLNGDGVVNVVDMQIDINAVLMLGCEAGAQTQTAALKPSGRTGTVTQSVIAGAGPGAVVKPASIVDLGTLGGNSATAYGLNDLGQVVGASDTGQRTNHAFLWEAGHMADLDIGDSRASAAYSVNNAVQIVGAYSPDRDPIGFLFSAGTITTLSHAPHGHADGINNAGQIVGDLAIQTASARQAFLWNAGDVVDLGTFGGTGSEARAINDSGQIAGSAHLKGGLVHAFLYSGTGLADLGTLGGKDSMAYGIDNVGEVVGTSQTDTGLQHAFLYRQASMIDLGTLGGNESQADGINDSGWIVGWSRTATGAQRAFLWRTGRMVDLNSLVSAGPGIWLEEATAINAAGQIVANAGNGHAYLITLPAETR